MHDIRLATAQDAAAILGIYKPFVTDTPVTFEETVPSLAEFEERIRTTLQKCPWLVYETDHTVAGYAYAADHRTRASYRWTKEVSVYVHPGFRRHKIASGLYTTLLQLLRLQGATNVLAGITLPNVQSVSFHESFGFKPVGVYHHIGYKLNQWHDVGWWELRLGERLGKPDDTLKTVEEIMSLPGWNNALDAGLKKIH